MTAFPPYHLPLGSSRFRTALFLRFATLFLAGCLVSAHAEVRLPSIFASHLVLQESAQTPIWGWADPGESIHITIGNESRHSRADSDGKWQIALDLSTIGPGPHLLSIQGDNLIELDDVLVGEVWLASGQSNMLFRLSKTLEAPSVIARSANPQIREFFVQETPARYPQEDVPGSWSLASPDTTPLYSGVAYHFAKSLQRELGRPVGIINASSGGTMIEAWTSFSALSTHPDLNQGASLNLAEADSLPTRKSAFAHQVKNWLNLHHRNDRPIPTLTESGAPADLKWTTTELPGRIREENGAIWLKKTVTLTAAQLTQPLYLNLQVFTGFESVYWNGQNIGATSYRDYPGNNFPREYYVPTTALQAGDNTLAIRVFAPVGPTRHTGKSKRFRAGPIRLGGPWDMAVEYTYSTPNTSGWPQGYPYFEPKSRAASLFNGMIHPITPFKVAGVLWYQGESNAKRAWQYRETLPLFLQDWRNHWGREDLPIYLCQLPGYQPLPSQSPAGSWPELREAQSLATKSEHTEQAILIDIGEERDIHPRNKRDAGQRLARIALAKNYDRDISFSGPIFDSMRIDGDRVHVHFHGIQRKLIAKPLPATYQPSSLIPKNKPLPRQRPSSELEGFALRGKDGNWHWADARIVGDSVVIHAPSVLAPVAVRYAWTDFPTCNLSDESGLPTAPFRTDNDPSTTKNVRYGLSNPEAERQ